MSSTLYRHTRIKFGYDDKEWMVMAKYRSEWPCLALMGLDVGISRPALTLPDPTPPEHRPLRCQIGQAATVALRDGVGTGPQRAVPLVDEFTEQSLVAKDLPGTGSFAGIGVA